MLIYLTVVVLLTQHLLLFYILLLFNHGYINENLLCVCKNGHYHHGMYLVMVVAATMAQIYFSEIEIFTFFFVLQTQKCHKNELFSF